MRHKSDAEKIIQNFITLVQTQFNTTIKTIRTDNGLEYLDKSVQGFLTNQVFIIKMHVHTLPNKMGWLREKIDICLKLLGLLCLLIMFPNSIEVRQF